MDKQTRIVEINGIKVEVDLRTATRVEQFRVGDPVKVLIKDYSAYSIYPGVIVSFDEFVKLPTINVAYIDARYTKAELKFVAINSETKDAEIAGAGPNDLQLEKSAVLSFLDGEVKKKELEIQEIRGKRDYFLNNFKKYFAPAEATT